MPEPAAPARIRLSVEDRIAVIRLADPERRNAMSLPMREQCLAALRELESGGEVDAIVITGEGDKAFSAGADLDELAQRTVTGELSTRAQLRRELPRLLETMRLPTLAAINGYCLGAGLELALACTLRIASDDATLGLPEVNLGVIPGSGGTQRLTRLVGMGRAMELVTLGDSITAAEAHRIGLVNRVVPTAALMAEARALAAALSAKAPLAVRYILDAAHVGAQLPIREAQALEAALFGLVASTDDMREGTAAFLQKRPAEFKGR
jgi:enoyl-CoA hydratase/carnithine racemase